MATEILDDLEDQGLIPYDESDLPKNEHTSWKSRPEEICTKILEFVVQDCKISNRELSKKTGIDRRAIGKYRSSDMFIDMLISVTNHRMLSVRSLAVEELEKLLRDPDLNANTRIKAIQTALSHTERMVELQILAGKKDVPAISVDDLMKELSDMN